MSAAPALPGPRGAASRASVRFGASTKKAVLLQPGVIYCSKRFLPGRAGMAGSGRVEPLHFGVKRWRQRFLIDRVNWTAPAAEPDQAVPAAEKDPLDDLMSFGGLDNITIQ